MKKIEAVNQDESLPILEEMLNNGFDQVVWVSDNSDCRTCRNMNDQTWSLDEFIQGLRHQAPIFEKSHVGCLCKVKVLNSQTGEEQFVNYEGLIL